MTRGKISNSAAIDILSYHRKLLADEARTGAYRDAIGAVVRSGDVVADLGCGTGILSFLACRAGAKRVYAIDERPVIALARELSEANGFADRIVFIEQSSFDVALPEPVDVIVTETMGNNGFDEQIAGAIAHAKRAWLGEGGTIIPRAVSMRAVPIELTDSYPAIDFWRGQSYGLDFAPLARRAANAFYPLTAKREEFLAEPATLARVVLGSDPESIRGSAGVEIVRDGILRGLAVWFHAELSENISLTNEPPHACVSWKQSLFPIAEPLAVRRGQAAELEIQTFDGIEWRWSVTLGDRRAEQSTFYGYPFGS